MVYNNNNKKKSKSCTVQGSRLALIGTVLLKHM